jgi:N-acetyl-1-D-myo-inositol-2-amino-2-deoxy-alpha-D-glucopyranoside deacetylase
VAMRAAELAAAAGFGPAKIYWTAVPKSVLAAGMEEFAESSENPFEGATSVDELPFGTPDDEIAARIDARASRQAKAAAIRAHATQIPVGSWIYTLAENLNADYLGVEFYTLAAGNRGPGEGPQGWETDLFAGL